MTPEDVAEEKAAKKAGKAYDKAMPEADTSFGKLNKDGQKPPVTKALKIAKEMEFERTSPMAYKMAKDTPMMAQTAKDALKSGLVIPLAMGVDMITGPKRRSAEDMSELTREVAKGMKKGGMTASSRADGCAERGKTRGKII